ncbi:metallophosphoesterase family protein [Companilactobacillus sp. HBUAS56275]|uniref:Metallophosphoesterase n=1 Tax=Candidatus Companilactobacillus pullicola TaxID=2838523 RepID=A0A9D1ZP74_9LACO|nr:metallophosphoesterase [Candidatus Companilactobacillus pullicola]
MKIKNIASRLLTPKPSEFISTQTDMFLKRLKPRPFVIDYIKGVYDNNVKPNVTDDTVTLSVLTDTHAKAIASASYYGINGIRHIIEANSVSDAVDLDLNVHLGDLIDGSDKPEISRGLLKFAVENYENSKPPFFLLEGNHDENDKYDEHRFFGSASFHRDDYDSLVTKYDFEQSGIFRLNPVSKVGWYDKGDIRIVFIDTSDIPYILSNGSKKYDFKKVRGVREQQLEDLITILENTVDKHVIVMGHANIVSPSGRSALNFNGDLIQQLLVSFNNKNSGQLKNELTGDFGVNLRYDFSSTGISKVTTYICGHMHYEKNYKVSEINHIILNCSALMGKKHGLTTDYNKKWDRRYNEISELAGYFINIDPNKLRLQIFGYGAATRYVSFEI